MSESEERRGSADRSLRRHRCNRPPPQRDPFAFADESSHRGSGAADGEGRDEGRHGPVHCDSVERPDDAHGRAFTQSFAVGGSSGDRRSGEVPSTFKVRRGVPWRMGITTRPERVADEGVEGVVPSAPRTADRPTVAATGED